jgi:hypothetical protein
MKKFFNLIAQPRENIYRGLIECATVECKSALLVVRVTSSLSQRGKNLLTELNPYLQEKQEVSEWPGTKLLGSTAWVFRYYLGPECSMVLQHATDALYDWMQPDLPEDLCLIRENGEPWLISIAHERDGYFELYPNEKTRLVEALPSIRFLIEEKK